MPFVATLPVGRKRYDEQKGRRVAARPDSRCIFLGQKKWRSYRVPPVVLRSKKIPNGARTQKKSVIRWIR